MVGTLRADGQVPKADTLREMLQDVSVSCRNRSVHPTGAQKRTSEALLVRVMKEQRTLRLPDLPLLEVTLQPTEETVHGGSLVR
jgi:hypothetical protein